MFWKNKDNVKLGLSGIAWLALTSLLATRLALGSDPATNLLIQDGLVSIGGVSGSGIITKDKGDKGDPDPPTEIVTRQVGNFRIQIGSTVSHSYNPIQTTPSSVTVSSNSFQTNSLQDSLSLIQAYTNTPLSVGSGDAVDLNGLENHNYATARQSDEGEKAIIKSNLPTSSIALRNAHNGYMVVEASGQANGQASANRVGAGPREKFKPELLENSKIALRNHQNKYLVSEATGAIHANRGASGPWEVFTIDFVKGSKGSYKSTTSVASLVLPGAVNSPLWSAAHLDIENGIPTATPRRGNAFGAWTANYELSEETWAAILSILIDRGNGGADYDVIEKNINRRINEAVTQAIKEQLENGVPLDDIDIEKIAAEISTEIRGTIGRAPTVQSMASIDKVRNEINGQIEAIKAEVYRYELKKKVDEALVQFANQFLNNIDDFYAYSYQDVIDYIEAQIGQGVPESFLDSLLSSLVAPHCSDLDEMTAAPRSASITLNSTTETPSFFNVLDIVSQLLDASFYLPPPPRGVIENSPTGPLIGYVCRQIVRRW